MDPTRFGYQKVLAELVGSWRCIGDLVCGNNITQDSTKCEANLHIFIPMSSRYLVLAVTLESLSVFHGQKCVTTLIVTFESDLGSFSCH